jgi:hypothetical protein
MAQHNIADPRVIEIASEGQQGSRQDAFCLPALHRGQWRDIVRQRPPMGASRGSLTLPLARDGRRPAKKRLSAHSSAPLAVDFAGGLFGASVGIVY